jgi:signal transduction histidine kinase
MEIAILIITCTVNLALGGIILFQDPKASYTRAFALASFVTCVWIISDYITNAHTDNILINDIANRLAYVSGFGTIVSGLVFTNFFPVKRIISRVEIVSVVLFSLVVFAFSATTAVAGKVSLNSTGSLQFSNGFLLWFYILGYVLLLGLIIKNLLKLYLNSDKILKTQTRLVLIAFCVSALTGLLINLIIPTLTGNWHITIFGPLATVVLVVMIVYAITRHGLFDIRLAIVRSSAYALSLGTLAVLYYIFIYVLSGILFKDQSRINEQSWLSIGLALILAFFFQPIKRVFDRLTNRVFYKDNYDNDDFFARLNRIITLTTDLNGLLRRSTSEIAMTLKAEQAFFVVRREDGTLISTGTDHHSILPLADVDKIDMYVKEANAQIIIHSLLAIKESDNGIRRLMIGHRLELILPLVLSGKIIGYLCLGDQKSSKYTQRDVNVLETASDELTIAIQNALAVQEIREFNTTLQQRIANATKELRTSNAMLRRLDKAKDEFVSMASHQLRTPLTSVKGYISMVLEGDAGKVSESQRQLLDQAFNSSERMVRLIDDFLNVSRIQNGKFIIDKHPIDLSKIVTQELDSLQSNALAHKTKFIYSAPKDFPIINLDEGKIRQVIMNFADNALYYSNDNSSVEITLAVEDENAILKVKDSGIGVPRDEQEELFTKFYRASNARRQRPDGTGVGLYLAKRIITAHGGKMIFESVQDKGSTFGFSVPLKQD